LLEPWLDKRGLAVHLVCSVRSVERLMERGLPYSMILGRAKFQLSTVLPWLEEHGYVRHHREGRLGAPDERSADAA
jgi:hypothetical protein